MPIRLPDEPRERDPLQQLVFALFVVEGVFLLLLLSSTLFSLLLYLIAALFILSLFFRGARGVWGFLLGFLRRVVGWGGRGLWGAFRAGLQPRAMQPVYEYHLRLSVGSQSRFIVQGTLVPRPLQAGDHVRVWVRQRNQRPYFQRGLLQEPQRARWIPLTLRPSHEGFWWLLGFLLWTGFLGYLYLNQS